MALALVAVPTAKAEPQDRALMACLQDNLTPADLAQVRRLQASGRELSGLPDRARAVVSSCLLTNGTRVARGAAKPPRLTVSPTDPAKVTAMSRFRSCAGHDYSGASLDGTRESNRSMKNYLYVSEPWTNPNSISIRAPFAGTVYLAEEGDNPLGTWVRVVHRNGWAFTAFHVDPAVKEGQRVRAGAPLATFPPANARTAIPERLGEPEANFDFSLESLDGRYVPFTEYLTPAAAAPWSARGFTTQALTISRAERDAQPCPAGFPDGIGSSGFVTAAG